MNYHELMNIKRFTCRGGEAAVLKLDLQFRLVEQLLSKQLNETRCWKVGKEAIGRPML